VARGEFDQALKDRLQLEEPQNRDGQVIVPTSSDFRTVNAVLADDATSFFLVQNMFETLVGLDPVEGTLVPGLLDYWEFAADGVTYTFHLPQNVTWHDGQPFTAEDVQFSYDMTLNEAINNSYRSSIMSVTESYRVVDPYTFEITAKPSAVTFLADSPGSVFLIP
jgi:peptide/nickel transport system substrate-binding protein